MLHVLLRVVVSLEDVGRAILTHSVVLVKLPVNRYFWKLCTFINGHSEIGVETIGVWPDTVRLVSVYRTPHALPSHRS
eukprot:2219314-Amphidinium_carterae.1